jgi:hypothetical protein
MDNYFLPIPSPFKVGVDFEYGQWIKTTGIVAHWHLTIARDANGEVFGQQKHRRKHRLF